MTIIENIKSYDFFDLVLAGELGVLDIDNFVERLTDNYRLDKLKKLLYDLEYCLFCDREEREGNISTDDRQQAINDLESQSKEVPVITVPPMKNKKGEIFGEEFKILNLEKMFYPYEYLQIYGLIGKIKYHIRLQETEKVTFNSIPQLPANLTTDQINCLFELLVNGDFILGTTDNDCFKWVFGDPNQTLPDQWKPITWKQAKQGLRELLKPILGKITNQHIRDVEKLFCDKNGRPFKMSKPKKDEYSVRYMEIENIVKSLK